MRRWVLLGGASAVVLALAGLYWFQPWKLFTSKTVNDSIPAIVATTPSAGGGRATPPVPVSPVATLVREGNLVSHEHATSGTVQLVRLADGRHQLILRDLSTSDGPDLRVWLTDRPVLAGADGWEVFDDGKYVELGRLKGDHGTQAYDVPAEVDVSQYRSVSIWCKRFSVSFGAAALT